ncbi:MAG: tRNA preQ1(34) S-adenosylmethionine ribosyltransferase-isomerase QueA [Candidatus Omnitrophica bacterium]|nr:tRNA preQ1(34) S-adenosylmethionine ribosyltransferase-isomerase QueA [Candidatus Omnitrophota bacterium]
MRLSDFDYQLPAGLIAQYPAARRDAARLLVVNRTARTIQHDIFHNIGAHLPAKSLLVVNDSKVIPARLLGNKPRSGGQVEVFLLKPLGGRRFEAMVRPLKKVRDGEPLVFDGGVTARLVDRAARVVEFDREDVLKALEKSGHIPLPPYIKRPDEASDRINYQTVYARPAGSVAAPTAGLHFTKPLLAGLKHAGHDLARVTLHVNYGTFKPVEAEDVVSHPMHSEDYRIGAAAEQAVRQARADGRAVVAVGTTSCRVLEAYARTGRTSDATSLFMYPGAEFKLVDALITNFHLPKSTLLMLVAAFGGLELVQKAYAEAIREYYRFYSYGDAMLIV